MRLTRKKAIEITKELWTWLAETGETKYRWPGWEKYGDMQDNCALCEYDSRRGDGNCGNCPYYLRFDGCGDGPFGRWCDTTIKPKRKLHAKAFLAQLEEL